MGKQLAEAVVPQGLQKVPVGNWRAWQAQDKDESKLCNRAGVGFAPQARTDSISKRALYCKLWLINV